MEILSKILNNSELAEKIRFKCDIELYPQLQKSDDMDGKITWNIDGKAFGVDASGGEFILLSDGTIGFNSSEGETGRIAENTLIKFFKAATREPQYKSTYHEEDGSLTLSEPFISRPMGEWIRKNIGE